MRRLMSVLLVGVMMMASATVFAETVYATKNGKKYHHADCPMIEKKSPAAVSMEDVQKRGLKPCGKCFKESAKAAANPNMALAEKKK